MTPKAQRIMEGKCMTVCLMVCSMEDIHTNWSPLHFYISFLTYFQIKFSNFPANKKEAAQKRHLVCIGSLKISGSLTEHTPHAKSNTL